MKLWKILLAVWMMLWGLLRITNLEFAGSWIIMGVLAIAIAITIIVVERGNPT